MLLVLATITIRRGTSHRQHLIQDLQRSEETAKEARDLLQTTISSIGDGVITAGQEGKVIFLNPIAQSLTGWSQADAVDRPLQEVFNIRDEDTGSVAGNPVRNILREGIAVGTPSHALLIAQGRPSNSNRRQRRSYPGAQGHVTGVVLVFRDITQRREAELIEKKAAAALARHSELLARTNTELQHFAYAASHDLREPLRTITAYTQLVQLRGASQLDKKSAECLQFIVEAADRMGLLIDGSAGLL